MKKPIPDLEKIHSYECHPEKGPKVLFFSGGTALNNISTHLKSLTHNSIHLITPFDSGGSSAILRHAFDMPAVGDLRSRLMALADETVSGQPDVFQLFVYRLPKDQPQPILLTRLNSMIAGEDRLIQNIETSIRDIIIEHLKVFLKAMPENFDLKGASIGNLILAGGYLNNEHDLDKVIQMFSDLVNVQGHVLTIINTPLQLAAKLENGQIIIGQHLITGKESSPIDSPIQEIYITATQDDPSLVQVQIDETRINPIQEADLICYPAGSLYTSVAANLLPKGVGQAIQSNPCPKIYFPSLGNDPERFGKTIDDSIFILLEILKQDLDENITADQLLNYVLIDSENGIPLKDETLQSLNKLNIQVIDTKLVSAKSQPYYDPALLNPVILSLGNV